MSPMKVTDGTSAKPLDDDTFKPHGSHVFQPPGEPEQFRLERDIDGNVRVRVHGSPWFYPSPDFADWAAELMAPRDGRIRAYIDLADAMRDELLAREMQGKCFRRLYPIDESEEE